MTVKQQRLVFLKNIIKDALVFVIVFFCVMKLFRYVRFPKVDGNSMYPLFNDSERICAITNTDIEIGDVVVIWSDSIGELIIKRVVGLPGDHIYIQHGHLYRNGTMLYEGYINEQDWQQSSIDKNIIVPEGEVFVMGDNRNYSTDSRVLGPISIDNIQMRYVTKANWIKYILD